MSSRGCSNWGWGTDKKDSSKTDKEESHNMGMNECFNSSWGSEKEVVGSLK